MSNAAISPVGPMTPLGAGAPEEGASFGVVQSGDMGRLLGQLDSAGAAQSSSAASSSDKSASIAKRMLNPLTEFRKNFDRAVNDISGIVARGGISMQDLIHIQFQMTQLSYMNDISAKAADKLSQGTQTLFRNQG